MIDNQQIIPSYQVINELPAFTDSVQSNWSSHVIFCYCLFLPVFTVNISWTGL